MLRTKNNYWCFIINSFNYWCFINHLLLIIIEVLNENRELKEKLTNSIHENNYWSENKNWNKFFSCLWLPWWGSWILCVGKNSLFVIWKTRGETSSWQNWSRSKYLSLGNLSKDVVVKLQYLLSPYIPEILSLKLLRHMLWSSHKFVAKFIHTFLKLSCHFSNFVSLSTKGQTKFSSCNMFRGKIQRHR